MDQIFSPFSTLSLSDLPEYNVTEVLNAISSRNYPTLYAALRKYRHTFSSMAAFRLVYQALECELTRRAILTILERCPPVEEFLFAGRETNFPLDCHGLVELAACLNRADILALLLERGGNVNRHPGFSLSPLEAALEGMALGSVELLARQPELDTAWTPRLRNIWSRQDPEPPKLEFCLQTLVPRFFREEYSPLAPLPVPEGTEMTALAIQNENWPLARRLLQERPPRSQKEARGILAAFQTRISEGDQPDCAAVLTALLESRPGLLRGKRACQVLLQYWLSFSRSGRAPLQPWVKRIPFRQIDLPLQTWECVGAEHMLPRWNALLPKGPTLAVDRWSPLFEPYSQNTENPLHQLFSSHSPLSITPEVLARILEHCPILGRPKAGKLSPLTKALVQNGRLSQLEAAFSPGGALEGESPDLLLEYCQTEDCPRPNRAAILAHIRKEETYDL